MLDVSFCRALNYLQCLHTSVFFQLADTAERFAAVWLNTCIHWLALLTAFSSKKSSETDCSRAFDFKNITAAHLQPLMTYLLPSRLYCRFWNLTKSCALALADFTADREFHPALKIIIKF
jgi:hypothetical protein